MIPGLAHHDNQIQVKTKPKLNDLRARANESIMTKEVERLQEE